MMTSDLLSQDEIDALLNGVDSGAIETEEPPHDPTVARTYDFASQDRIVRGRRPWVPAVLKYNTVPARTLFEVCNLNNPQDRALLQTRAYRQKVAEAVVQGILGYYGPVAGGNLRLTRTRAK